MLSDFELAFHRNGTDRFIKADPTRIILTPRSEVMKNGTKSFKKGRARAAQDFKIIWAGDNGIVKPVGQDGGVRRFDFILVGRHDAEVEINDTWKVEDQLFVVEYKFPFIGYEVKVGGVSHGSEPT